MDSKILKWGNSHAVRIPLSLLNSLGLKEDDRVIIDKEYDKITITKSKHKTIAERLEGYGETNPTGEFWGDDIQGRELW